MLRSVLVCVVLVPGWLGQCVVTSYNGTTTLDQQASVSVETSRDAPDRTSLVRFPIRPFVNHDNIHAGGGTHGVYVRPPPIKYHRRPPPPPIHHNHHLHHQLPPKYYNVEPPYGDEYFVSESEDQCNVLGPLLAMKTAGVALFKVAVAKLPLLALKLLAKGLALLVVLGPLLLPLLLLFPVPVYGFNNFGNGFAITGNGGVFNPNNNIPNNNNNGNFNNGNFNKFGNMNKQDGRHAAVSRLPHFARGPCLPRLACEMGYWGYKDQIAWILDHATESATPTFPKLFNAWKRAYQQGGKGRDCATLYFCPTVDRVMTVIEKNALVVEEAVTPAPVFDHDDNTKDP